MGESGQGERCARIFGVRLERVMSRTCGDRVPTVCKELILRLLYLVQRGRGKRRGGLFCRLPAEDRLERAKRRVDTEGSAKEAIEEMDEQLLAGLLRLYLMELPVSVLVQDLYECFLDNAERVERLKVMVQKRLPRCHRWLAEVLVLFLLGLEGGGYVELEELAMVFGQAMLRCPRGKRETLRSCARRVVLLKTLMYNFELVFEPGEECCSLVETVCQVGVSHQRALVDLVYREAVWMAKRVEGGIG
ncbi:rho GTPase-activating protein gacY-like [Schistocerca gregaria]|uniref:rho GTPase-activating protein gacY-like n=1 Tax=Schistocerca gregaria TaxID=7010 RepID=UPI00211ECEC0|nr:rho GTPase-activating protein gacY-like [Schistocerca gregaria]